MGEKNDVPFCNLNERDELVDCQIKHGSFPGNALTFQYLILIAELALGVV